MRYETERKQFTRRRVLKVAARAIRAEGPHGDIASADADAFVVVSHVVGARFDVEVAP